MHTRVLVVDSSRVRFNWSARSAQPLLTHAVCGVACKQAFIVFAFVGLNLFWFQKLLSLALRKARGESKSPDKRRKRD
jgi:hypothetical protein